ncbi:sugar translocase [bacterium]|nr:sugar translocase [bacterium]MDY4504693.1 hypothetical protein [Bariatricus sp.]
MSDRSRTEYSIINMTASVGGYVLNVLLSFICRMVFVRQLNSEYLGINGLFSNILSMLSLAELGIGTAMIYALYKPVAEDNHKKIAAYMKVYGISYKVIGIVIGIIGVALIPFLDVLVQEPPNIHGSITGLYLLFLFSTVSSYFFSYRSSILIANQKNYIVLAISYAVVIVQNIAQIVSLIVFENYTVYLVLQVVFVLLSNILISVTAVKQYPYIADKNTEKLSKQEIKILAKNIKALTVTKLSGILVNNTDNIVITYFNGLITTGVVSNYSLLANTINSLANQVFNSISASLGNLNAIGDEKHKYQVFKALNLANFWIYGWAAIGIVVLSNDIIELFFGSSYVMEIEISVILAINFYMLGMQCVVGIYKSTMGLFRYGQYILLITAVLNLIGDVIFGYEYGVFGIFLATAVSRLFTNTWYEPMIIFKYGFHLKFRVYVIRYCGYLALLIGTCTICFGISRLVLLSLVLRLIIKCVICIVIPNVIFLVAFYRLPEFKYLFSIICNVKEKIVRLFGKR